MFLTIKEWTRWVHEYQSCGLGVVVPGHVQFLLAESFPEVVRKRAVELDEEILRCNLQKLVIEIRN